MLSVKLDINLNDLESVMLSSGSSPQYRRKFPDVFPIFYFLNHISAVHRSVARGEQKGL